MSWLRRPTPSGPRVTLVDRAGCHLCAEAAVVVASVAGAEGQGWTRVDVDASPELLRLYADDVPVVLVDGHPVARWRVSEAQLRVALRGRPRRTRG